MRRRVQRRTDGFLFISIPRNCGYDKNDVVEISKKLSEEQTSDNNMIPRPEPLEPKYTPNDINNDTKKKGFFRSLIPELPTNEK